MSEFPKPFERTRKQVMELIAKQDVALTATSSFREMYDQGVSAAHRQATHEMGGGSLLASSASGPGTGNGSGGASGSGRGSGNGTDNGSGPVTKGGTEDKGLFASTFEGWESSSSPFAQPQKRKGNAAAYGAGGEDEKDIDPVNLFYQTLFRKSLEYRMAHSRPHSPAAIPPLCHYCVCIMGVAMLWGSLLSSP